MRSSSMNCLPGPDLLSSWIVDCLLVSSLSPSLSCIRPIPSAHPCVYSRWANPDWWTVIVFLFLFDRLQHCCPRYLIYYIKHFIVWINYGTLLPRVPPIHPCHSISVLLLVLTVSVWQVSTSKSKLRSCHHMYLYFTTSVLLWISLVFLYVILQKGISSMFLLRDNETVSRLATIVTDVPREAGISAWWRHGGDTEVLSHAAWDN